MNLKAVRHVFEYLVFRGFACAIGMMNVRQINQLASFLATIMVDVLPRKVSRYTIAESNLKLAFGESLCDEGVRQHVLSMWKHLFRMVAEIVQTPRMLCLENSRESVIFRDRAQTIEALASGRPVIVLSGHFGNWEISTACFGIYGCPMGLIARAMDNPYLHQWFAEYREFLGHQQILKKGGFDDLIKVISKKGFVGLLADQDAGPRGLFVEFFGRPASTFKSIALLAKEYDALICVGYARRMSDDFVNHRWSRYEVGCNDVIDPREYQTAGAIKEMTQRFTSSLEQAIRMAPEQYFWVHRRWKHQPKVRLKTLPQESGNNIGAERMASKVA